MNAPIFWTEVLRDGAITRLLRCPVCGAWGEIDDDQFHGRMSIEHSIGPDDLHPDEPRGDGGCAFHERVNVAREGERLTPSQYHADARFPT